MNFSKIKKITKDIKKTYDITVENNHNFFCNNFLIHNCDYRGEIGFIMINHGKEPFEIKAGDRIGQLVLSPVVQAEYLLVRDLSPTDRGSGGYGSTGKK